MTVETKWQTLNFSRRNLLRGAIVAAGSGAVLATGLMAGSAAAQGKIAQKLVSYQTTPKLGRRCDGCLQWVAPNGCKVVAGDISPSGWCTIYAPKHK